MKKEIIPQEVPFFSFYSQHEELYEDLISIFADTMKTGQFIGGPGVEQFEAAFASYVGTPYAVGMSNGTEALAIALLALGVGQGQKVITVPNSFIATAEAISSIGAQVEFVDIDPQTCLMDLSLLEKSLKASFASSCKEKRPAAIIPVHLYGQCVNMKECMAIADRFEVKVLEDACQAHGASFAGRMAGSWGHAAAFSFYPSKNLGAFGDAGILTTQDPAIYKQAQMLRDHGQSEKYFHQLIGRNGRLDALQARILHAKLPLLEKWNEQRRKGAEIYNQAFKGLDWIRPVQILNDSSPVYHLYVVHVEKRQKLQDYLKEHGISTALHYPRPIHLQDCYKHLGYEKGSFPCAEKSAEQLLSLPMFPGISDHQLNYVVDVIRSFTV